MTLHSRAFTCAFRRLLRAERRRSPALRRAMRRRRRPPTRADAGLGVFFRVLLSGVPAVFLIHAHTAGWPAATAPAIAGWWFLIVILGGASVARGRAQDLPIALVALPLARADLERLARRRVLALLPWAGLDAAVVFGALALLHGGGVAWLAALPLAAFSAVAVWAACLGLARWPLPGCAASAVLFLPCGLLLFVRSPWLIEWLQRVVTDQAPWLTLLSPGGWLAAAFLAAQRGLPWGWLAGVAPALLLAAAAPRLLAGLVRACDPEQRLLVAWGEQTTEPAPGTGDDEAAAPVAAPGPLPPTADVAAAVAAEWHAPLPGIAKAGWMERRFLRGLDARERLVLECIVLRLPTWTRQTWRSLQFLAGGIALAWVPRWVGLEATVVLAWGAGIAIVVGLALGLPLAFGFDAMTAGATGYGLTVARAACLPLDPREFLRLTQKAAVIRGLAMLPATTLTGALLGWAYGLPPLLVALGGAKLALLSVAGAPCLCAMGLSSASNDSQIRGLKGLRAVGLLVGGLLATASLGLAALFVPRAWGFALLAACALVAWGVARRYLRHYHRGGFDLVQAARL